MEPHLPEGPESLLSAFTTDGPVQVDWQPFTGAGPEKASDDPMSTKRRAHLRKLGLSDLEIQGLEALGLPPMLEMLFVGMFLQARTTAKAKTYPWWKDLGLEKRPTDRATARAAYSSAMLKAHPDHGGTVEAMAKVRAAWERVQREFPAENGHKEEE